MLLISKQKSPGNYWRLFKTYEIKSNLSPNWTSVCVFSAGVLHRHQRTFKIKSGRQTLQMSSASKYDTYDRYLRSSIVFLANLIFSRLRSLIKHKKCSLQMTDWRCDHMMFVQSVQRSLAVCLCASVGGIKVARFTSDRFTYHRLTAHTHTHT